MKTTRRQMLRPTMLPLLLSMLTAAGCSADVDDSRYVETPMAFAAHGNLVPNADAAATIDFTDGKAEAQMAHGADGCVDRLEVTGTSADGKDVLTLVFAPRATFGMALTKATLKRSEGTWSLTKGDGWLPLDTLDPGYDALDAADQSALAVNKLLVWPRGKIELERLDTGSGDLVKLDLRTLWFGGDIQSAITDTPTCKKCSTDDCKAPFPTWRLRDFQKESRFYNLRYDMNAFLGKTLVTITTQGW